jgi:glycosyltransferase involved in cell wall biosynthesis
MRMLLSRSDVDAWGLVRVGGRLAVLDRAGLRALDKRLRDGGPWAEAGIAARLKRRDPAVARAQATVRRLAVQVVPALGLGAALPPGTRYLNVGHSNLEHSVFAGLETVPNVRTLVLIHDTIPLDFPHHQRAGTVERFRDRLTAAIRHADRIVVPSRTVVDDLARHAATVGPLPEVIVAPLGLDLAPPAGLPDLPHDRPYFLSLGTIEPRKNHARLLDLWEDFHATLPEAAIPRLFVVGRRGWRNEAVFARLDGLPFMGQTVIELDDIDDGTLSALLSGSAGLLHPSLAEGFGLPPHEAAALGVTPVCAPLAVYRETLGDAAVYADPDDLYQWRKIVLELAERDRAGQGTTGSGRGYNPPAWEAHFKLALTTFC